jgi:hypothetical protein
LWVLSKSEPFDLAIAGQRGVETAKASLHQAAKPAYLVVAGSDKSIVAQVAADVGRDYFTVDAIARHKVFILSRGAGSGGGRVSG